ncbi:MAG: penicillin-binding protein 2 [Candidatus Tectomicrobia bacterium]|nr:penicillin-binding protein 2 [Candidatus Tectomicrobia bacterium]
MKEGHLRRLIACGALVGLGFGALAVKLFLIQIRDREFLVSYAERQLRRTLVLRPKRGEILDAQGRPLAVSVEASSLYANPQEIDNPREAARSLSQVLGVAGPDLERKLSGDRRYVWLLRKITPEEKRKVMDLGIDGLGFAAESRRFYPKRELASSLLGFVGVDEKGLSGVERAFEGHMGGRAGRVEIERDARGRSIHPEARVLLPPRAGADVRLTIDEVLQFVVEKELAAQVAQVGARRGMGVMVEPSSGRVLAMASVPGFNPNAYERFPAERWREAALQEVYEPGSTFKLITAAAYLESGGDWRKMLFCEEGLLRIGGGYTLRDHKRFGWLSAEQVIVHSSNIGAYKLGMEVGPARLYRMARRFGFGEPMELGLAGEAGGILRPPARWSGTSLAAVSIGQEVGVTPLQMVMTAAAIANGGVMPAPRLVEDVERDGQPLWLPPRREMQRVISARTAAVLAQTMRKVVAGGGGVQAEVPGYGSAGKTGTAQKLDRETKTYSRTRFVMSFVGFVPYKNPRLALLVVIDEGRGKDGAWGGSVAAPVWRRIAWQSLRYLRVPPEGAQVLEVAGRAPAVPVTTSPKGASLGERVFRIAQTVHHVLHGSSSASAQEERGH